MTEDSNTLRARLDKLRAARRVSGKQR